MSFCNTSINYLLYEYCFSAKLNFRVFLSILGWIAVYDMLAYMSIA